MDLGDLAGKFVLVTGASRGIGAAVARGFAHHGAHVAIHWHSARAAAEAVAADARAMGVRTLALTAKDGGKIKAMVDCCLVVPTDRTDRAQEIHLAIQHAICDAVEQSGLGADRPATT